MMAEARGHDITKASLGLRLVRRAIHRDATAQRTMFAQFLPDGETVIHIDYFGLNGLWQIGMHNFACVTDKRLLALQVGWLGRVIYSEAYLEDCNSSVIQQPTLILLYMISLTTLIITLGLGIFVLPFIVRTYYRFVKSGGTMFVREGRNIEIFADRKEIGRLNRMWRAFGQAREKRLRDLLGYSEAEAGVPEVEGRAA